MNYYSYLFVFYKNINKTNIFRGELISLIELQNNGNVIHIETVESATLKFEEVSFKKINEKKDDPFINILFLPQSAIVICDFQLDIKEIIRRSGYIQSCGKFLFLKKWEDISIDLIERNVENFCKTENNWYNTVFYKSSDNKIENKLDSLLIDDKRYHIKNKSFNNAVTDINENLKRKRKELNLKNRNEHIFIYLEKDDTKSDSLLSDLYYDRNIIDYGVCYLGEYKKDNPIHEMDDLREIKPYWAGIFTTPHRLMNAMLNLAKVNENSTVLVPFSHTGTLAIEASNIGCKIIASDIMGTVGAKDNYDFLCKGSNNFKILVDTLDNHINDKELSTKLLDLIDDSIFLNNQGLPETKDNNIEKTLPEHSERLYFYIMRRYAMELRRGADIGVKSVQDFVKKYINKLDKDKYIQGYDLFGEQLELFENVYYENSEPIITLNIENDKYFIDSYYKSKRVGYINKKQENYPIFQKNDICDSEDNYNIKENSIDAVITDPPYGYGEGINVDKVREIYTKLIEKSIKWLKPNGYIIICALDKVKTGRTENLLFTEDIIDIINITAKKNKVKFTIDDILLTSKHLKSVYYWKSRYALNRSIISVQINK